MANIIIPMELLDTDTEIQKMALNAVIKGASNKPQGDSVCYHIYNDKLDLNIAKILFSKGVTINEYQLFIKVNNPYDLVPETLIGAKQIFPKEGEIRLKWNQWVKPNSIIKEINGEFFVPTDGYNGIYLPLGELVPVMDDLVHPHSLPKPTTPINLPPTP